VEPTEENIRAFDQRHRGAEPPRRPPRGLPAALHDRLHALEGRRVLHLGCGAGEATRELAAMGALVTGLDRSADRIAAAQAQGPGAAFVVGDPEAPPPEVRRGRFDLVLALDVLDLEDAEGWAAGIASALRAGGEVIVHDEHPAAASLDAFGRWGEDYFALGGRIGRLVTALAGAGLVVRLVEELPARDARVPGELLIAASKPA
jgi:predicted TPR repeat methyltransferase